jgi:hypothetical protein
LSKKLYTRIDDVQMKRLRFLGNIRVEKLPRPTWFLGYNCWYPGENLPAIPIKPIRQTFYARYSEQNRFFHFDTNLCNGTKPPFAADLSRRRVGGRLVVGFLAADGIGRAARNMAAEHAMRVRQRLFE